MRIRLTKKAERGIGLRSASTGKLTRYGAGDELTIADKIAISLVNSGLAVEIEGTAKTEPIESKEEAAEQEEVKTSNEVVEDTTEEEEEPTESYEDMTKDELIAICKKKGITSRGTKDELIARLTEE